MRRLEDKKEVFTVLDDMAKNDRCYWRYQDSCFGGLIPVGHRSHERMYEDDEPENVEQGVSCYGNPYELLDYMSNKWNNPDKTDVILFIGRRVGEGMDGEDIVKVTEDSDILYSLSLRCFYKWVLETDYVYVDWKGTEHEFSDIVDMDAIAENLN